MPKIPTPLPTRDDVDEDKCVYPEVVEKTCLPRVDLSDAPLSNADLVVFVDGSAS